MKTILSLLIAFMVVSVEAKEALVKITLGKSSAPAMTALKPGGRFTTSSKSRSEVSLDNGLIRTGSNTSILLQSRDMISLEKGLTLVASKPSFFRRRIQVQTPSHQLSVKGTAQIYYSPGNAIRVVVIEGSMTISLNSLSREKVTLKAGQVLLINPTEAELPEPLEIDLNRLVASAGLLADQFQPLPTQDLIADAGRRQAEQVAEFHDSSPEDEGEEDADESDEDFEMDEFDDPSDIDARNEELLHAAAADAIDDLDGDGDPDDGLFKP